MGKDGLPGNTSEHLEAFSPCRNGFCVVIEDESMFFYCLGGGISVFPLTFHGRSALVGTFKGQALVFFS